jgi:hypothetical protein
VSVTPAIRDFLVELDAMLDARAWPMLDRPGVTVGTGDASALVRLPHTSDHARDVEVEIDDHHVIVIYAPERIEFAKREEALRFVEMLGDGRVVLVVRRGIVLTTMESYRDDLDRPFRRSRIPLPTLRPRTERHPFGFT